MKQSVFDDIIIPADQPHLDYVAGGLSLSDGSLGLVGGQFEYALY